MASSTVNMSALQKQMQTSNLPRPPPSSNRTSDSERRGFGRRRDYRPVRWDKYFDSETDVETINGNIFKVYRAGHSGPLLILLHGGGYSGLTWALLTDNILKLVECQVAALDLRGHGSSKTRDDDDLSATTMAIDVGDVISKLFVDKCPPVILVGHSMGGAIAVHAAYQKLVPALVGLIVIDVVEGTAIDALQSMQSFLRGRPSSFKSIENAIEWCVRTGQIRNLESAKVSVPGQIRNMLTGMVATVDLRSGSDDDTATSGNSSSFHQYDDSIPEEEKDEGIDEDDARPRKVSASEEMDGEGCFKIPLEPVANTYEWRIDLSKTEKHWLGWFQGLSDMFLDCMAAKLLLLAGVDRLDKSLTIGQMQGKFQMKVLPQCGHIVHEDVPDKVAEVLASFLVRNKFARPMDNFHGGFPDC